MRVWLDMVFLALAATWKWLLVLGVIVVLVTGGLFAAGVFAGSPPEPGESAQLAPVATPAVAPTATPVPVPTATQAPVATATVAPAAPTPTPVVRTKIDVPVNLTGARNLGSLEFVLVYEPSVLEFAEVKTGSLARDALIDFGTRTKGRLWAGLIDANGINGDGPVAIISFNVVGPGLTGSPLSLESVYAYDASTLLDVLTESSPGSFAGEGRSVTTPSLSFPR
ncbi:MAG: hypothetical protein IH962_02070 [Chloroflexi bacterium]|nr:hypothetical protein [Chloroflexota bacterium]